MTAFAFLFVLAAVIFAMDITIKRVYRYPKTPHKSTPAKSGIPFEEVGFATKNGRRLYGWWIPALGQPPRTRPTVVLVHGWGRNLERMMPYVTTLHPQSFNLFAFDLRGHGSSEVEAYPNMLKFSEDIRAAIDFLIEHFLGPTQVIGVIGLSVGGAAAVHAAAADDRIAGVLAVGAFAHPVDVMRLEFEKRSVPYFPIGWLMLQYLQLRMRVNFDRIAPENVARRSSAKILLIHGEQDKVVPVNHGRRLLASGKTDRTELWVVPHRGHSDCNEHPEFWDRATSFLQVSLEAVDH
jgi:pimeloyl-ACP methyl ester carboxylesterase